MSTNARFYLSYDIKNYFEIKFFGMETLKFCQFIYVVCAQYCYRRHSHNVTECDMKTNSGKNTDFNTWPYNHSQTQGHAIDIYRHWFVPKRKDMYSYFVRNGTSKRQCSQKYTHRFR